MGKLGTPRAAKRYSRSQESRSTGLVTPPSLPAALLTRSAANHRHRRRNRAKATPSRPWAWRTTP